MRKSFLNSAIGKVVRHSGWLSLVIIIANLY